MKSFSQLDLESSRNPQRRILINGDNPLGKAVAKVLHFDAIFYENQINAAVGNLAGEIFIAFPYEERPAFKERHASLDWQACAYVIELIETLPVATSHFILLSSFDVPNKSQWYHKHRHEIEKQLLQTCKFVTILRFPQVFGPHTKNYLLNDIKNNALKLFPSFRNQWYNVEWLQEDLPKLLKRKTEKQQEIGLATPPITNHDLIMECIPSRMQSLSSRTPQQPHEYTVYKTGITGLSFLHTRSKVKDDLKRFTAKW